MKEFLTTSGAERRVSPGELALQERVVRSVFLAKKPFHVLNSKVINDLFRSSTRKSSLRYPFLLLPP